MAQPTSTPKIEELRFKVKTDPKSRLFFPLAEELRKNGNLEEAEQVLRSGLEHHPSYLSGWVSLGRVLREAGSDSKALEALNKALQVDPGNVVAARLLADVHYALGDKVEAIKKYKLVYALLPGDEELEATIASLETELNPQAAAPAMAAPGPAPTVPAEVPPLPEEAAFAPLRQEPEGAPHFIGTPEDRAFGVAAPEESPFAPEPSVESPFAAAPDVAEASTSESGAAEPAAEAPSAGSPFGIGEPQAVDESLSEQAALEGPSIEEFGAAAIEPEPYALGAPEALPESPIEPPLGEEPGWAPGEETSPFESGRAAAADTDFAQATPDAGPADTPWGREEPATAEAEQLLAQEQRIELETGDAEPMSAAHAESPFEEPPAETRYTSAAFEIESPAAMHIVDAPLAAEVASPLGEEALPLSESPESSAAVPVSEDEADVFAPAEAAAAPETREEEDLTNTLTMADLYARQGLLEEARQIYRNILQREPGNEEVQRKLAALEPAPNASRSASADAKIRKLEGWLQKVGRREMGDV